MKQTIFKMEWLVTLLLFSCMAHAQQFDWVRTYTGSDHDGKMDNRVEGTVTDSDGNLYTIGQCAMDAHLDGVPLVPYGFPGNACILVAKFSPDGELIWHKVIATEGFNSPGSIRIVGDTSIVFGVGVTLQNRVYWLDTLYTDVHSQMQLSDSLDWRNSSASITLNKDGELKGQHFLHVAFIDDDGDVVTFRKETGNPGSSDMIDALGLGSTFNIDQRGNFIYCRHSNNTIGTWSSDGEFVPKSLENGLLTGLQIWVDGHARFTIYPPNQPKVWNPELLKFSPDFTELLAHQFMFENEVGSLNLSILTGNTDIKTDSLGSIYYMVKEYSTTLEESTANIAGLSSTIRVGTLQNYSIVIKCDNNLNPVLAQCIRTDDFTGFAEFKSLALSESGADLLVSGYMDILEDTPATIGDDTIDIVNKVFFLRLDTADGHLKSYGTAKSTGKTAINTGYYQMHQICTANNRVFVPCYYTGDMFFGQDTAYNTGNRNNAICIWDTLGNDIGFINIPTNHPTSTQPCNVISLHDSNLYISGYIEPGFTVYIGDTSIGTDIDSKAYITKYFDPSFASPYVTPSNLDITKTDAATARVYPNPTSSTVHITLPDQERIRKCYVVSSSGMFRQETPTGNTLNLSDYPPGIYYLELLTEYHIYKQKVVKL